MRRRTISQHQSDQSCSVSKNSRVLGYYNNLQSSYQQDNDSFQMERNQYMNQHESIQIRNNSKQTLKNKASRINQLEPTGYRLIDTSSYIIPQVERRRVRSFLNDSLRERSRVSMREKSNQSFSDKFSSDSSIRQPQSLITLPEPPVDNNQVGYLMYLNRHRGLKKPYDFAKQVVRRNNDISMVQEFQKSHHRCFESAKLRYHDLMVPDKLKVGNNPLKMYRYREKKREHSRLIQLGGV